LGIAASEIDKLAIFETAVGYEKEVVKDDTPLVPLTLTPVVGTKFDVKAFYKLKE
jgi:hypothetical protein